MDLCNIRESSDGPLICATPDAILEALAPHLPRWRKIESAPRDGTNVIAWWSASKCFGVVYYLSHWVPLPASPTEGE